MLPGFLEKRTRLGDPVVTAGDRCYCICSQNGLFPDPWGGNVPHETWGVWAHPIKLFDGYWLGVRPAGSQAMTWLSEAVACRVDGACTEFEYSIGTLRLIRRDFVPDGLPGMVVTLEITAPHWAGRQLEARVFLCSELLPAWRGDEVGLHDAPDTASLALDGTVVFRDSGNDWVALAAVEPAPVALSVDPALRSPQPTAGQGASAELRVALTLDAAGHAALRLFLAGSPQTEGAARATLRTLQARHADLLAERAAQVTDLGETARLESPDPAIDTAFRWAKLTSAMMAQELPPYGRGARAGLPQYPWWFGCDTAYAVAPLLQGGLFELARDSLLLLKRASTWANPGTPGRVLHELTTTGVVTNPGNLVETPLFTRAAHEYWLWTGDRAFLEEIYPFCRQGILDYALGRCDPDGDLCPAGRSIIETLVMHAGFECIDVATYTWEALKGLAGMAAAMGDDALVSELEAKADALARRIREEWWMPEEGLFGDVRASIAEVERRLEAVDARAATGHHADMRRQAIEGRAHFAPALAARAGMPRDVDLPWLLRHWIVAVPLEAGVATPEQAAAAFARLESPEFGGSWGPYLHPDRQNTMSLNAGVHARAAARYGRGLAARDVMGHLAESACARMPGAISEALPDQWCFLQLWSALGVISPIVESFLGVAPHAAERRLRVVPNLPPGWDRLTLRRLRVGADYAGIAVATAPDQIHVHVTDLPADYRLAVGCIVPEGRQAGAVRLNGRTADPRWEVTLAGPALVVETTGPAELAVALAPDG